MARHHPQLQIHAEYSDQFVDLIADGFDCAIRVGALRDSNLIARRVGQIYGKLVASPDYIRIHGSPETPDEIAAHQALIGTEAWRFMDGDKVVTVQPQGRFSSDNGAALANAAAAGLGIAWLPDCVTHEYLASGALVPLITRFPLPVGGVYVVRPPSPHPARKVRILSEFLIESFEGNPAFARSACRHIGCAFRLLRHSLPHHVTSRGGAHPLVTWAMQQPLRSMQARDRQRMR
ncbi:LysR substrate binding domain-containing protein [Xaviernesmea oryzae]|uniref:LysR substrate binding domain-containing protein n=1 Tax=Xaviernesmea oryzae TaxID=464029 RepID=A0A1X7DBS5_9HYPH|nr:LysR substrate binding domain-containing protein [Xaviernesmea oryzae]